MADEEVQTPADVTATTEVEHTAPTRPKRAPRSKKAAAEQAVTKPKTRGLSDREKLERIGQIEAQVGGGSTLKDAVKIAGVSDQTYYQWKKAVSQSAPIKPAPKTEAASISGYNEIAEFIELEQENRRLRKLLSEKLRAENADLRKRLGLK